MATTVRHLILQSIHPSHPIPQQDRQHTYNVTLRRVCATIVTVEINKYDIYQVCVCSLRYPACNTHMPYCHLLSARLYNIFFFTLTKKRYVFRGKSY